MDDSKRLRTVFHKQASTGLCSWPVALCWFLAVLPLGGPTFAQATLGPEVITRVDGQAKTELAKDKVGGVTVGLVCGPRLCWTKSYGFADMERKIPASTETIYRIGSITKQFTAVMLLQLVQQGKLRLSDPVAKYFPEVDQIPQDFPDAPAMTIIQLATHTAGLVREPDPMTTFTKGPVSDWETVLIAALPHAKYLYKPGTRFSYSNFGYAILGASLSRAAGQPYVAYVDQHVFKPLGMSRTFFEPNVKMSTNLARGYGILKNGALDSETPEREHQGRGYKVPNGAVYTTVTDLSRFVSFEMGEGPVEVLKPELLIQIHQQIADRNGDLVATNATLRTGYGIGFFAIRAGNTVIYGHAGEVAGYEAAAFFEPHSQFGVIVLRNAVGGEFGLMNIVNVAFEPLSQPRQKSN